MYLITLCELQQKTEPDTIFYIFAGYFLNKLLSYVFSLHYYFLKIWMSVVLALSYGSFRSHLAFSLSSSASSCKGVSCGVLWSSVVMSSMAQPIGKSLPASGLDLDFPISKMGTKSSSPSQL